MKRKKSAKIFIILFALLLSVFLVFSVYAVEDESLPADTPETEASVYTEATTVTQSTYQQTTASSAVYQETTAPTVSYQESSEQTEQSQYVENVTEASSSAKKFTLPTVDMSDVEIPTAVGSDVEGEGISLVSGIIVWLCVAAGVAVILAVIFSTKAKKKSGIGRFESGNKMDRRNRLADDKYYRR
ncbi:MAG: hypothetical protein ACI4QE_01835 [Acutalibacteraceae bacterium]